MEMNRGTRSVAYEVMRRMFEEGFATGDGRVATSSARHDWSSTSSAWKERLRPRR